MSVEEITKKEFWRILFEGKEQLINEMSEIQKDYSNIQHMQDTIKEYINHRFKIKYYYNEKTETVSYGVFENSVGFKK